MSGDLDEFKKKISNYSVEQLEEILISINTDKFPEKHQIVHDYLRKKVENISDDPGPKNSNLDATLIDESRVKPSENASQVSDSLVKPKLTEKIHPQSYIDTESINKDSESKIENPAKEQVFSQDKNKSEKKPPTEEKREYKSVYKYDESKEKEEVSLLQFGLWTSVILSGILALYIMALTFFDLPGKEQVLEFSKILPKIGHELDKQTPEEAAAKIDNSAIES